MTTTRIPNRALTKEELDALCQNEGYLSRLRKAISPLGDDGHGGADVDARTRQRVAAIKALVEIVRSHPEIAQHGRCKWHVESALESLLPIEAHTALITGNALRGVLETDPTVLLDLSDTVGALPRAQHDRITTLQVIRIKHIAQDIIDGSQTPARRAALEVIRVAENADPDDNLTMLSQLLDRRGADFAFDWQDMGEAALHIFTPNPEALLSKGRGKPLSSRYAASTQRAKSHPRDKMRAVFRWQLPRLLSLMTRVVGELEKEEKSAHGRGAERRKALIRANKKYLMDAPQRAVAALDRAEDRSRVAKHVLSVLQQTGGDYPDLWVGVLAKTGGALKHDEAALHVLWEGLSENDWSVRHASRLLPKMRNGVGGMPFTDSVFPFAMKITRRALEAGTLKVSRESDRQLIISIAHEGRVYGQDEDARALLAAVLDAPHGRNALTQELRGDYSLSTEYTLQAYADVLLAHGDGTAEMLNVLWDKLAAAVEDGRIQPSGWKHIANFLGVLAEHRPDFFAEKIAKLSPQAVVQLHNGLLGLTVDNAAASDAAPNQSPSSRANTALEALERHAVTDEHREMMKTQCREKFRGFASENDLEDFALMYRGPERACAHALQDPSGRVDDEVVSIIKGLVDEMLAERLYTRNGVGFGDSVVKQLPQFVEAARDPRIADEMVRLATTMMRDIRDTAGDDGSESRWHIWFGSEKGINRLVTMIETFARYSSRPGETATELAVEARRFLKVALAKFPRDAKPAWARLGQEVLPALMRLDVQQRVGDDADDCARRLDRVAKALLTLQKRAKPTEKETAKAVIRQTLQDATSDTAPCGHVIRHYPRLMRMAAEHADEPVPAWAQPQEGDTLTQPVSQPMTSGGHPSADEAACVSAA